MITYPRQCDEPGCVHDAPDASQAMQHHIDSGHVPPPFCWRCQCLAGTGKDGAECRCPEGADLDAPWQDVTVDGVTHHVQLQHRFEYPKAVV